MLSLVAVLSCGVKGDNISVPNKGNSVSVCQLDCSDKGTQSVGRLPSHGRGEQSLAEKRHKGKE